MKKINNVFYFLAGAICILIIEQLRINHLNKQWNELFNKSRNSFEKDFNHALSIIDTSRKQTIMVIEQRDSLINVIEKIKKEHK